MYMDRYPNVHTCEWKFTCIFVTYMNSCNLVLLAQVWHCENGEVVMLCEGIVSCEESVVLCLNLSQDNSRLVASNSTGLVMVSA